MLGKTVLNGKKVKALLRLYAAFSNAVAGNWRPATGWQGMPLKRFVTTLNSQLQRKPRFILFSPFRCCHGSTVVLCLCTLFHVLYPYFVLVHSLPLAWKLLGMLELIVGWLFWTHAKHVKKWLFTSSCHFNATLHTAVCLIGSEEWLFKLIILLISSFVYYTW